ncbi:MAG: ubiquitin-like domain-containing protein [Peptococcaceae bacterium]|nr:ubiquitin-like domain-containing protein [Peptococcaceae bacterium]
MGWFDFIKSAVKSGKKNPPSAATIGPVWIVAGLTIVLLAAGIVFGFAWTSKTVTLVDGKKEVKIKTRASDVNKLLQEQNTVLGPYDRVKPELSAKLSNGSRVEVLRANRITITVDNETLEIVSAAETVGDVLKEKQIALGGEDIVKPDVGEKITGETEIRVVRVRTENEVVKAPIPYRTKQVPNDDMARGISRTVIKGKNGEELQTWLVAYHDNQVVSRQLVDRKTLSNPVDRVVQVGTGQTVSRGGKVIRFREAMEVIATAYTHTGHNTASGTKPEYGVVAVDPQVIPLGTRMYIEGYGYAKALDTGGAIKGKRIDVFVESYSEADRWGVRTVKVYLLD